METGKLGYQMLLLEMAPCKCLITYIRLMLYGSKGTLQATNACTVVKQHQGCIQGRRMYKMITQRQSDSMILIYCKPLPQVALNLGSVFLPPETRVV